jgi:medium-chain acyl-[acyl-carrier-protein] hydrolase
MATTRSVDARTWFAGRVPSANATCRLFCFPYAGLGASAFRTWIGRLPPTIDVCPVQLPGRETRQGEPPRTRLMPLSDEAAAAILPFTDVPYALFGHSLGAILAFEVARLLEPATPPVRLFVSARRAPHLPDRLPLLHRLAEPAFLAEVQLECADLMSLLAPRLRADIEALETWTYVAGDTLSCPISAFGGLRDHTIRPEEIGAWRDHTNGAFTMRLIDDGHLYLQSAASVLLPAIAKDLKCDAQVPA